MRLRIHPAFGLYLAVVAALSTWETCLAALGALAVHEAGHAVAGRLLGEPIERIDLTPFGGVMTYAPGKSPSKGMRGVIIAAAGPLANYLALLALGMAPVQAALGLRMARAVAAAQLAVLCVNLLPALPLDGGGMLLSLGYYVFPAGRLILWLSRMGVACGVCMMLLAAYGAATLGTLNCSLLLIGLFLIAYARRSMGAMLAQNLYAVVQERLEADRDGVHAVRAYRVGKDTRLFALLAPMERAERALFLYEDARGLHVLDENEVYRMLVRDPLRTVSQALDAQDADNPAKKRENAE